MTVPSDDVGPTRTETEATSTSLALMTVCRRVQEGEEQFLHYPEPPSMLPRESHSIWSQTALEAHIPIHHLQVM